MDGSKRSFHELSMRASQPAARKCDTDRQAYICPPLFRLFIDTLTMRLPICVDIRADMWSFEPVGDARRNGMYGNVHWGLSHVEILQQEEIRIRAEALGADVRASL
jgi:hypothetical protein